MFNKMDEEQYDIRKDHDGPLLIEDNQRDGAADLNSDVEPEDMSELNGSQEKQMAKAKLTERQLGSLFEARRKDELRAAIGGGVYSSRRANDLKQSPIVEDNDLSPERLLQQ